MSTANPSDPSPENNLAAQKLQSEIVELNLKIKDLKTPEYKRPSFWLSVSAAVVALIGVVAQGTLSTIRSERATLATERAQLNIRDSEEKRDAAISAMNDANNAAKVAKAAKDDALQRLEEARMAEQRVWYRISEARLPLSEALEGLAALQHAVVDKPDFPKIEVISGAMERAVNALFRIQYKVLSDTHRQDTTEELRIFVWSTHSITQVYVFSQSNWQQLIYDNGFSIMRDNDLISEKAMNHFSLPHEFSLKEGKYVFVSYADDLIVPESIVLERAK